METILSIETKKTLYKPFLIKINGKAFRVKEITLDGLEMTQNLEKELMKGNTGAFRKMLAEVIEGPMNEIGKLPISKLREVVQVAMGVGKTKEGKEQKKGHAPAPAK